MCSVILVGRCDGDLPEFLHTALIGFMARHPDAMAQRRTCAWLQPFPRESAGMEEKLCDWPRLAHWNDGGTDIQGQKFLDSALIGNVFRHSGEKARSRKVLAAACAPRTPTDQREAWNEGGDIRGPVIA
jgi:hypothetical protein